MWCKMNSLRQILNSTKRFLGTSLLVGALTVNPFLTENNELSPTQGSGYHVASPVLGNNKESIWSDSSPTQASGNSRLNKCNIVILNVCYAWMTSEIILFEVFLPGKSLYRKELMNNWKNIQNDLLKRIALSWHKLLYRYIEKKRGKYENIF